MGAESISLILAEDSGLKRVDEPITVGIPLKKGFLFDKDNLSIKNIPLQTEILARWADNSIKWILLDFKTSLDARKQKILHLKKKKALRLESVSYEDNLDLLGGKTQIIVFDRKGKKYKAHFSNAKIETKGNLRTTIKYTGKFKSLFNFTARLSFYADSKLIKLDFTIHNPRPAHHKGGFWDLGDKNSALFKDLSIRIDAKNCNIAYKDSVKSKIKQAENIVIYQDSSGKKNWDSRNHVNKNNKITTSFKGYKIYEKGKEASKGNQAQPTIFLKNENISISAAVKDFWQNFPKAIEADNTGMTIRLFPKQYNDFHELQPGEQKTHTLYFDFDANDLSWIQSPIFVRAAPEYYEQTQAIPYLITSSDKRYQKLIDNAIKGKTSFEKKNEIIDQYGWRNFGDIFADHEAIKRTWVISHYNNQYDVINGAFLQFLKSGNKQWLETADNMAKHVRDIDIYHTKKDRNTYNGGMFWHTFHYMDVKTCTHRSYAKHGENTMEKFHYGIGGGPSNEHNYATGLKHHYFLTGDLLSKQAVLSLANWVIDMDDGSKSILKHLNHKPTGKASCSLSIFYQGPGRGSGNSLRALLDGFDISNNQKYLSKAEELIRRCIHPKDNIEKHNLHDIEHRWFYLIFLQALGRYLDIKVGLNQKDKMFYYARVSLLHYAGWMLKNEQPYKEALHKVDIPGPTWSAHDIRKSNIFDYAYKYSGNEIFKLKSEFFFNKCIEHVNTYEDKATTRPLAILMHYSVMHDYFIKNKNTIEKIEEKAVNFGKPKKFKPQGYYLYKIRDMIKRKP